MALGSIFSVILFSFLGYYLSSAAFIFGVMWVMKERRWKMLVLTPVAWVAFTYLIFQRVLFIGLPTGILPSLLF